MTNKRKHYLEFIQFEAKWCTFNIVIQLLEQIASYIYKTCNITDEEKSYMINDVLACTSFRKFS